MAPMVWMVALTVNYDSLFKFAMRSKCAVLVALAVQVVEWFMAYGLCDETYIYY